MGTFNITSSTLNNSYEYKATGIIVTGNYSKDAQNDKLQNVSGSCYRVNAQGEQGDYIGNFNGYVREGGEIRYSLSEMSRRDSNLVWDAIDEIETNITGNQVEE
jgi:hypothetical protein